MAPIQVEQQRQRLFQPILLVQGVGGFQRLRQGARRSGRAMPCRPSAWPLFLARHGLAGPFAFRRRYNDCMSRPRQENLQRGSEIHPPAWPVRLDEAWTTFHGRADLMSTRPSSRSRRPYMMAVVLGTALTALGADRLGAAEAPALGDIGRYC